MPLSDLCSSCSTPCRRTAGGSLTSCASSREPPPRSSACRRRPSRRGSWCRRRPPPRLPMRRPLRLQVAGWCSRSSRPTRLGSPSESQTSACGRRSAHLLQASRRSLTSRWPTCKVVWMTSPQQSRSRCRRAWLCRPDCEHPLRTMLEPLQVSRLAWRSWPRTEPPRKLPQPPLGVASSRMTRWPPLRSASKEWRLGTAIARKRLATRGKEAWPRRPLWRRASSLRGPPQQPLQRR
mmetsp:Transcript_20188/g.51554  ORF Transcript_20188/g.51554 Transcript_20188/m.51554 type:complete len:236 (-) Transcript_20188:149-856(-)